MSKSRHIYVPRGTRQQWVAENTGKHLCQCGCGEPVPITTWQYPNVPRYRHGHNSRVANPYQIAGGGRATWAAEEQGKHVCECGCGEAIRVLPEHYAGGVPRLIVGHYGRRPSTPEESRESSLRRFLAAAQPGVEPDDCWSWSSTHARNGRALIVVHVEARRTSHNAARIAYQLFRGSISDGHQVDHTCRNRGCVNPWHLDAVTHAENNRRRRLTAEEHRALAPKRPDGWQLSA